MFTNAENIVNVGVFAHVDAGKTTLTEKILFHCGKIRKAGSVNEGTTQTDWLNVERERGISVRAAVSSVEWNNCIINMIDTPGHIDFAGEVERVFRCLDGAVLLVSSVEGVQSHTINLWKAFEKLKIPRIVVINKIDRMGSNFKNVISKMESVLGAKLILMNMPKNQGFREVKLISCKEETLAALCDNYDDLALDWLDGKAIKDDLIEKTLKEGTAGCRITPLFCASAQNSLGIDEILNGIVNYLPHADKKSCDELSAFVFKIEHDKEMGKIAHVRMFGGTIKNRDTLFEGEKVSQIRKFNGSKFYDVGEVSDGDIAALCGLSSPRCESFIGSCALSDMYRIANPFLTVMVTPQKADEITLLVHALKQLCDEDPLMNYRFEQSEREINIDLTGEIQLQVIAELLKERYNLSANFSPPSVIYKETPTEQGIGFEAYTMPKPCWAVVKFYIEPLENGKGIIYDNGNVPNNQLFYKYQEHIKTSLFSSLEQGLYGWEVTDMKVTLVGGEHHTMHTHPLDFFVATPMAFMDALRRTGTTLLEPRIIITLSAEEDCMGKIINEITLSRGEFDTPVLSHGSFTLRAILPVATSIDFPIKLASITSGKGIYFQSFYDYHKIPFELGKVAKRRGINPLDRSKWILWARGAIK